MRRKCRFMSKSYCFSLLVCILKSVSPCFGNFFVVISLSALASCEGRLLKHILVWWPQMKYSVPFFSNTKNSDNWWSNRWDQMHDSDTTYIFVLESKQSLVNIQIQLWEFGWLSSFSISTKLTIADSWYAMFCMLKIVSDMHFSYHLLIVWGN